jgi:hypothetical protein
MTAFFRTMPPGDTHARAEGSCNRDSLGTQDRWWGATFPRRAWHHIAGSTESPSWFPWPSRPLFAPRLLSSTLIIPRENAPFWFSRGILGRSLTPADRAEPATGRRSSLATGSANVTSVQKRSLVKIDHIPNLSGEICRYSRWNPLPRRAMPRYLQGGGVVPPSVGSSVSGGTEHGVLDALTKRGMWVER